MSDAKMATAYFRLGISTDWFSPITAFHIQKDVCRNADRTMVGQSIRSTVSCCVLDGHYRSKTVAYTAAIQHRTSTARTINWYALALTIIFQLDLTIVDGSRVTVLKKGKALSNAITSNIVEIDEGGSLDELWMGLKAPVASAYPEQLGSLIGTQTDWYPPKRLIGVIRLDIRDYTTHPITIISSPKLHA